MLQTGATEDTIWKVPTYLPYVQPPLTAAAVASAEEEIGHKLPAEYLRLLRRQNGGYIRYSLPSLSNEPTPDIDHERIYGIGPHFPSLKFFDWDIEQETVDFPLKGLVPFDGAVHWYLCLDYRRNVGEARITYVELDCNRESPVATSFSDYLSKLHIRVRDEDYVLEGISGVEKVKSILASALGVAFDPPDLLTYGYPAHRGFLGEDYLWLNSNTVPRGFVDSQDERFSELKNFMPGEALQFTGVPADAYILYVTEGIRDRVLHVCARTRIIARPLREYIKCR